MPRSICCSWLLVLVAALCFTLIPGAQCDIDSHTYIDGEEVILWTNRVGPFRNPQETYTYYSLPFCQPEKFIESDHEGLGEAMQGYELIKSPVAIQFKKPLKSGVICTKSLAPEEAEQFRYAIRNQYWYQLFLDDLPIWGMVGEVINEGDNKEKHMLYTHKSLSLAYNGNRVIEVNLTSSEPVEVVDGTPIHFTYSVSWKSTEITFHDRFDKYLDLPFFEHQIHWFSIFNSFMMVVFLVGLVSMILIRALKKDYARFSEEDGEAFQGTGSGSGTGSELGDDSGWKQVHGDVFRPPSHLVLFSALVGTGHQLVMLVFSMLFLAMLGTYYRTRGTAVTAFIVCYAFTSFVAGYSAGGYYSRNSGRNWIKCMFLTACLFPGVAVTIGIALNTVAHAYQSLSYVPFGTMCAVVLIWVFLSFPLTFLGTLLGKNWNGVPDNPCRINKIPRIIPDRPWYFSPPINVLLGGVLPFGSIFIEMYFIFTSFWHYKYYYVYGFLFLVYVILIVVTICVTIVSSYFLLNAEDYRWKWTSFLSAASTSVYVFLYATYYFFQKTHMSGLLQTCFYFGYMFVFCVALGILCGA
eukprot:CAMPEP_0177670308 /NCGR_PEP_ID=MMETSP0447-20121125/24007_1 /TAXON_ID=0 /ORGANISM="Stygamoeba regulata, Strain BSH-02190019" /LENGTH=578 /DNA_ID=CAMNT_0019177437 /DNA_START=82 /DNA_END=1814 /DNA_ORIENTATION=-